MTLIYSGCVLPIHGKKLKSAAVPGGLAQRLRPHVHEPRARTSEVRFLRKKNHFDVTASPSSVPPCPLTTRLVPVIFYVWTCSELLVMGVIHAQLMGSLVF